MLDPSVSLWFLIPAALCFLLRMVLDYRGKGKSTRGMQALSMLTGLFLLLAAVLGLWPAGGVWERGMLVGAGASFLFAEAYRFIRQRSTRVSLVLLLISSAFWVAALLLLLF